MAFKTAEIFECIEKSYPKSYALEWDNPGLTCGRMDKEVNKVLIALDCTDEVVEKAIDGGFDLVLTHHPMIFGAIKNVNDQSFIGRRLLKLISHDISLYAMHTNFDCAKGGMGTIVAEHMGVAELCPMEVTSEDEKGSKIGVGFFGELKEEMSARELSELIKKQFGLELVTYYDAKRPIKRIACCPGSGRGMEKFARELSADAFITGDMGHHDGIDAVADGISLIDAGHYGLEHIFAGYMAEFVGKHFPDIEVSTYGREMRRFV